MAKPPIRMEKIELVWGWAPRPSKPRKALPRPLCNAGGGTEGIREGLCSSKTKFRVTCPSSLPPHMPI
jgi:hypothetical protein